MIAMSHTFLNAINLFLSGPKNPVLMHPPPPKKKQKKKQNKNKQTKQKAIEFFEVLCIFRGNTVVTFATKRLII